MKYVVNSEQSIIDIADAIRAKTGSQDSLTVADMPSAITSITGGGGSAMTKTYTFSLENEIETQMGSFDVWSTCIATPTDNATKAKMQELIEYDAAGYDITVNFAMYNYDEGDYSYIVPYKIVKAYDLEDSSGVINLGEYSYTIRVDDGWALVLRTKDVERDDYEYSEYSEAEERYIEHNDGKQIQFYHGVVMIPLGTWTNYGAT